jgi:hypothetical protein
MRVIVLTFWSAAVLCRFQFGFVAMCNTLNRRVGLLIDLIALTGHPSRQEWVDNI